MGTASTTQHSVPQGGGAEVTASVGVLVDDGAGGIKIAASGTEAGVLVSDGSGGYQIDASGTATGYLLGFGTKYRIKAV